MNAQIHALSLNPEHGFHKYPVSSLKLIKNVGVQGDAHAGVTVKHRSRVKQDPTQPNLRQVHLIHLELLDELRDKGFQVQPGELGENITTCRLDLLSLPRGTELHISGTTIEITGLRNPCKQLDDWQPGLMNAVLDRDAEGQLIRKCGVMGVVKKGGKISINDVIQVVLPPHSHFPLEKV